MRFVGLTWRNGGYVIVKPVEVSQALIDDSFVKTYPRIYAMHVYGSKRGYDTSGTCFGILVLKR